MSLSARRHGSVDDRSTGLIAMMGVTVTFSIEQLLLLSVVPCSSGKWVLSVQLLLVVITMMTAMMLLMMMMMTMRVMQSVWASWHASGRNRLTWLFLCLLSFHSCYQNFRAARLRLWMTV